MSAQIVVPERAEPVAQVFFPGDTVRLPDGSVIRVESKPLVLTAPSGVHDYARHRENWIRTGDPAELHAMTQAMTGQP